MNFSKLIAATLLFGGCQLLHAGPTSDRVRTAGTLSCGLVKEEADYTKFDVHGNRAAFDADVCKAVAVAVLGERAKLTLTAYPDEASALQALKAGTVALLATGTPQLDTAGAASGLGFAPTLLFDAQGFLVPKAAGINSAKGLSGKKICFLAETETEENLHTWVAREKIDFVPFPFQEEGEMAAAFVTGNCTGLAGDITKLAFTRALFRSRAKDFTILGDLIAQDPLAPVYLAADRQWAALVNWTVAVLIQAEQSGITAANLSEKKNCGDASVRRLLGTESGIGRAVGLDDAWAARVIRSVGNYGEMFERDLGAGSPLNMPRGANRLWTEGGLLYSWPIRSE